MLPKVLFSQGDEGWHAASPAGVSSTQRLSEEHLSGDPRSLARSVPGERRLSAWVSLYKCDISVCLCLSEEMFQTLCLVMMPFYCVCVCVKATGAAGGENFSL